MRNRRLVYSTDGGGRQRPDGPGRGEEARGDAGSKPDDIVRISRERAGRGGKTVTLVRGLPDRGPALEARAAELKRLCGAGGTVKDGAIEIQGDHRERVAERLRALGLSVKVAGG
jgi:translation initiation factor 1